MASKIMSLLAKKNCGSSGKALIALFATLMLGGCASSTSTSYVPGYQAANTGSTPPLPLATRSEAEMESLFANLEELFSDLKSPDLEKRIQKTYAPELYFNDTFHTFTDREDVSRYLVQTADRVNLTTTRFDEYAQSSDSYFVRWFMSIEFEVNGELIRTDSIGVSQIKFNEQGQIVFHQDFWDNTEGFFKHLPVVGYVIDKAMDRL